MRLASVKSVRRFVQTIVLEIFRRTLACDVVDGPTWTQMTCRSVLCGHCVRPEASCGFIREFRWECNGTGVRFRFGAARTIEALSTAIMNM